MDGVHGRHWSIARVGIAAAGSLLAAALVVGPAAAAGPVIERGIVDGPHVDEIDCGSFNATLIRTFVGTNLSFFDAAGDLLRIQTNAQMAGSLTSSTGTVVPLTGSVHVVIDVVVGTVVFDGRVFMGTRPGTGEVIQDTGRYVVDADDNVLQDAGPHDVEDNPAIFCSALQ